MKVNNLIGKACLIMALGVLSPAIANASEPILHNRSK